MKKKGINMYQTLVVVADSGRARFYAMKNKGTPLVELADYVHTETRLHASELITDRQGRTFDSKGFARHAKESRSPVRVQQAKKFARQISANIEAERKKNKFAELLLVAAPEFLGMLRKALSRESGKLVTRQIDKDLVLMKEDVIRGHLAV
jgi:protein required for attachment to host cells